MRKIFSILVVLGMVLGMVVMTAPAVAQDDCDATVTLTDDCAGAASTYCVNLTSPYTMFAGNDNFIIEFPEGTTFGVTAVTATVDGTAATALRDGLLVAVEIPAGESPITAGDFVIICITGARNPAVDGDYALNLWVDMLCCPPELFDCAEYEILPKCSTYKALMDFSVTYPGLSPTFIPPFQACGQNDTAQNYPDSNVLPFVTTYNATMDAWFNGFNLTVAYDILGCDACCTDPEFYFVLSSAPSTTAEATMSVNGTWFTLTTETPGTTDTGSMGVIALEEDSIIVYPSLLHFDTVGDYEICFFLECATVGDCDEVGSEIKELGCFPFKVYQWKEAFPIPLYKKWNLISLPFVPFNTSLSYVLSALPTPADVMGTWYYDAEPPAEWLAPPATMEDGKAYWLKVKYTTATEGDYYGQLWVFGTDRPGNPPVPPGPYAVYEGWNMIGFTSLSGMTTDLYLAQMGPNFFGVYGWSKIYGWNPATQAFYLVPQQAGILTPGQGYWIEFAWDGVI